MAASEIDHITEAINKAGTEWGREGVARRAIVAADMSYIGLTKKVKDATGLDVLPPKIQREIGRIVGKVSVVDDAVKIKVMLGEILRVLREEAKKRDAKSKVTTTVKTPGPQPAPSTPTTTREPAPRLSNFDLFDEYRQVLEELDQEAKDLIDSPDEAAAKELSRKVAYVQNRLRQGEDYMSNPGLLTNGGSPIPPKLAALREPPHGIQATDIVEFRKQRDTILRNLNEARSILSYRTSIERIAKFLTDAERDGKTLSKKQRSELTALASRAKGLDRRIANIHDALRAWETRPDIAAAIEAGAKPDKPQYILDLEDQAAQLQGIKGMLKSIHEYDQAVSSNQPRLPGVPKRQRPMNDYGESLKQRLDILKKTYDAQQRVRDLQEAYDYAQKVYNGDPSAVEPSTAKGKRMGATMLKRAQEARSGRTVGKVPVEAPDHQPTVRNQPNADSIAWARRRAEIVKAESLRWVSDQAIKDVWEKTHSGHRNLALASVWNRLTDLDQNLVGQMVRRVTDTGFHSYLQHVLFPRQTMRDGSVFAYRPHDPRVVYDGMVSRLSQEAIDALHGHTDLLRKTGLPKLEIRANTERARMIWNFPSRATAITDLFTRESMLRLARLDYAEMETKSLGLTGDAKRQYMREAIDSLAIPDRERGPWDMEADMAVLVNESGTVRVIDSYLRSTGTAGRFLSNLFIRFPRIIVNALGWNVDFAVGMAKAGAEIHNYKKGNIEPRKSGETYVEHQQRILKADLTPWQRRRITQLVGRNILGIAIIGGVADKLADQVEPVEVNAKGGYIIWPEYLTVAGGPFSLMVARMTHRYCDKAVSAGTMTEAEAEKIKAQAVIEMFTNATVFTAAADIGNIMDGSTTPGKLVGRQVASGFIPGDIRRVARAMDQTPAPFGPEVRRNTSSSPNTGSFASDMVAGLFEDAWNEIKRAIPGARQTLPEKSSSGMNGDTFSSLDPEVQRAINAAGSSVKGPTRRSLPTGKKESEDSLQQRRQQWAERFNRQLKAAVSDPGWNKLSQERQRKQISEISKNVMESINP